MTTDHADSEHAGEIHHFEINVASFDESLDFWDWLLRELGYDRKNELDDCRSWIKGPTYVVLVQADTTDHPFDKGAPGLNHVAFHASSREQVDDLTAAIRDREDATVLFEDRHPFAGGYYALYCEDPGGIKVEIVGPE